MPGCSRNFPPRRSRSGALTIAGLACAVLCACSRAPVPGTPIRADRTLGGLGDTPGRFGYPRCLDADRSTNTLWVIDRTARVQRIDPVSGRCLGYFHMPKFSVGKPTGITVAPGLDENNRWVEGLLYIADTHYHRVMVYHAPPPVEDPRKRAIEPVLVFSLGQFGRGGGEFNYTTDVVPLISEDGTRVERLYVAEYGGNDRVSVFGASEGPERFTFLFSFGEFGSSADAAKVQFHRPQSLAIDRSTSPARLIVTDSCNHRLGVFTLEGALVRWLGSVGTPETGDIPPLPDTINNPAAPSAGPAPLAATGRPARFLYPYGLECLGDGTALVAEFGAARVQRIDLTTGECLGSWGRPGRAEGELAVPWAVCTLGGTAYALDSGNCRIVAFPAPEPRSK